MIYSRSLLHCRCRTDTVAAAGDPPAGGLRAGVHPPRRPPAGGDKPAAGRGVPRARGQERARQVSLRAPPPGACRRAAAERRRRRAHSEDTQHQAQELVARNARAR